MTTTPDTATTSREDRLIREGVRVRLYRRPEGDAVVEHDAGAPAGYERAATMCVFADGTLKLDDPEQLFLLEIPFPLDGERITFDEQPMVWARHADRIYRTGYLVAVIDELGDTATA